jgi:hypothetical protein
MEEKEIRSSVGWRVWGALTVGFLGRGWSKEEVY